MLTMRAVSELTTAPAEDRPLTLEQAKKGLSMTFGVRPEAIETTVRA